MKVIATATLQYVDPVTLPASSSLVFEVDNSGTVRGYLNDREHPLVGCTADEACTVDAFNAQLKTLTQGNAADVCRSGAAYIQ